MTPEAYLEWEAQQPLKYEYVQGKAYTMTGGTLPHNDIAVNLTAALKPFLRGKGCKVRMADAKVGISEQGPYFYPDIVVSCDQRDRTALKVVRYPQLIVEVLSPGTEGFDRGDKFKFYRRIQTLQEYVLIDSEKIGVESYRRNEKGKWELTAYPPDEVSDNGQDGEVYFSSLDFHCSLGLLYEDVELAKPPLPENSFLSEP